MSVPNSVSASWSGWSKLKGCSGTWSPKGLCLSGCPVIDCTRVALAQEQLGDVTAGVPGGSGHGVGERLVHGVSLAPDVAWPVVAVRCEPCHWGVLCGHYDECGVFICPDARRGAPLVALRDVMVKVGLPASVYAG